MTIYFKMLIEAFLRIFMFLILLAVPGKLYAQVIPSTSLDSLLIRHLQYIEQTTDNILDNPDRFIAGKLYVPRGTRENHPYFKDFAWKSGAVIFQDQHYPVRMMRYDIELDALIIMKTIKTLGYPIMLNQKLAREFIIDGRHFEFIDSVSKPGYYESVYRGHTAVWARYKKTNSNSMKGTPKYASSIRFILILDGSYIEIKNLRELYSLFDEKKAELKTYRRQNHLSFAVDKTGTMSQLVKYFDTIHQ